MKRIFNLKYSLNIGSNIKDLDADFSKRLLINSVSLDCLIDMVRTLIDRVVKVANGQPS